VTPGKPFAPTERAAAATPASKSDLNLEIRRNIYDQNGKELTSPDAKPSAEKQANGEAAAANGATGTSSASMEDLVKEPKKQFNCFSCGVDCTRVRYHSAKSAPAATVGATAAKVKYDLCPNCFLEGRFPSSSSAVDFVKLEDTTYSSIPDRDAPWTDAELLLLLEGLELFDDNWSSVADHVGTRTREECVLKFLQLEIEDKYLESEPGVNGSGSLGVLSGGRVPYTQADNPVLSVVGFLAGLGEPAVAAAAAGRTVDEMRRSLRERLEKGIGGEAEESSGKSKDKGKAVDTEIIENEDSMDVDDHPQSSASQTASTATTNKQANALATIPLATSAARAAALASHEEREMTRLVSSAVNTCLQKLELKLQQFNELESVLQAERRELERGRQQLFLDRLAMKKRVKEVEDALRIAMIRGGDEGLRMVGEVARAGFGGEKLGFRGVERPAGGDIRPLSMDNTPGYRIYEM
jgi:SWI/SNF related-matrix-associated actin-dependent regulator of chromatin subfamily C